MNRWNVFMTMTVILIMTPYVLVSADQADSLELQEIKTDEELIRLIRNLSAKDKEVNNAVGLVKTDLTDTVLPSVQAEEGLLRVSTPVPLYQNNARTDASQSINEMKSGIVSSGRLSDIIPGDGGYGSARTYTKTNIQVAGVDEADFVKNDGIYLYIVSGNKLSILRAYPPQNAAILSQTLIPGTVSDIFLSQDRLVVFTTRYDYPSSLKKRPHDSHVYGERASAVLYDISDRTRPEKIREISAPGRYQYSRMIGDQIYFLSSGNRYDYQNQMPVIFDAEKEITVGSLWSPRIIGSDMQMSTLTSFSITGGSPPEAITFLLGQDTTLYVSLTDLYIAYEKDRYGIYGTFQGDKRLLQGMPPVFQQMSVIHRFALSEGSITYKATGTVPGSLLNQFSLDQFEGNLRVATTLENRSISAGKYSNAYILDPDLRIIGRLEELAPGEKIYSARFMGDLLYLVTFKQTDPLFVIDLSDPYHPDVLGELKIPGYSDYLHPFDRTHLIGVGKDTYENDRGGVIPTGVKIALFDITDLNHPRIVDSRVIGEKGSDSAVLTDHRAFLLDREKNVMVLPIKEVRYPSGRWDRYSSRSGPEIWQGVYVFGVNQKGFCELGKVSHDSGREESSWWSGSTVRRSIFMDTILYTISESRIIGSDLSDLAGRVMKIDLTSEPQDPWYLQPLWYLF